MGILTHLIDFILHIDHYLQLFIHTYGAWVYALLFLIVFCETGVVVLPILPGDSLLFIASTLAASSSLHIWYLLPVFMIAAILGDQCNYQIGSIIGSRVFQWKKHWLFNQEAFLKAHAFYERYGAITIVLARFLPFMRTFVPFVAGAAKMHRRQFAVFNILGAIIWVLLVCAIGYFFGSIPIIKNNLEWVIWGLILIPGLLAIIGIHRVSRPNR